MSRTGEESFTPAPTVGQNTNEESFTPASTVGQNTNEVLTGILGYDKARIASLKNDGAIG